MLGELWKALKCNKKEIVAACWKVSGNSERIFAHSILASPGVAINDCFCITLCAR